MRKRHLRSLPVLLVLAAGLPAASSAQTASPRRTPVVAVVERVSPSVVNISAESIVREVDPFFGNFFGGSRQRKSQSLGSGLIIDPSGLVVTNEHVIEGASKILVTTLDGRELEATVLGSDRDADLAVLKVAVKGLPATPLGKSANLLMGETVVAMGNPFGLSNTVTTGVLSARGRAVGGSGRRALFTDFLQTDASINPGNSGGPLLDSAGRLIGINTAIYSPSGASAGIGFAVPVDTLNRVVPHIIRHGKYSRPAMGIELDEGANQRLTAAFETKGVVILRVKPGSPAAGAGLQGVTMTRKGIVPGDIITAVDGKPVDSVGKFAARLDEYKPGDRIRLTLLRQGRSAEATITLQPGE